MQLITRNLANAQELHAAQDIARQAFYTLCAQRFARTVCAALGLVVGKHYTGNRDSMTDYAYESTRVAAHFGRLALGE